MAMGQRVEQSLALWLERAKRREWPECGAGTVTAILANPVKMNPIAVR